MPGRPMRAIVVDRAMPAGELAVRALEVPTPGENELLVSVAACGVCFHDILARSGALRPDAQPFVPGHEVAGIVAAVGRGVTQFAVGDRVATTNRRTICGHCEYCRSGRESSCAQKKNLGDGELNGGYADYVCVSEDCAALVPPRVVLEHAAIAACALGTQLNAVRAAGVRAGERVLVLGAAGGLGIHGVQFARLAGGEVVALTSAPEKAQALHEAGAHHVVVAEHGANFSMEVRRLTGGHGVDVVIDNVGTPTFDAARKSLAPFGRWVFVGQVSTDFVRFSPAHIFFRGITILTAKNATRTQLAEILDMLDRKLVSPRIWRSFALEESAEAHGHVEAGRAIGRIIIGPKAGSA